MKTKNFFHPSLSPEKLAQKKEVRTWSRATVIREDMISKSFQIHRGQDFTALKIHEKMVGYRLGEFARTRRRGKDPRPKLPSRRKAGPSSSYLLEIKKALPQKGKPLPKKKK